LSLLQFVFFLENKKPGLHISQQGQGDIPQMEEVISLT